MGRGLSPLQKMILRLALAAERKPPPEPIKGLSPEAARVVARFQVKEHLRRHEVLMAYWGWTPREGWRGLGEKVFDPGQIGRGHYNSGQASLSRALRRLERRGLVRAAWRIQLTEAGVAVAEALERESVRGGV